MADSMHTPGPWMISERKDFSGSASKIECAQGYIVAEAYSHPTMTKRTYNELWAEAEANAEFIVRACNSHEALVEALSRIAAVKYPEADTLYALKATIDFVRDQANAALSTAESKK